MSVVMESIKETAQKLADYNMEVAPETEAIYFFPAENVVQLVMLDPVTLPSEEIVPYYFGASPKSGTSNRSAVVLIRPEEAFRLPLPPGRGTWEKAIKLWPQK